MSNASERGKRKHVNGIAPRHRKGGLLKKEQEATIKPKKKKLGGPFYGGGEKGRLYDDRLICLPWERK